jgi:hypothetical protein
VPLPSNRYEKAQKPLSSYEADINEFVNKQDEVCKHLCVCVCVCA